MNTRQIEYFLAVAENLSFTRAAEKMFVSQTAVTQQIHALEEQMGVQLFYRTKKKVCLTPAGQLFQTEGRQLLEHMETVVSHARDAKEGMIGSLKIGFANYAGNILSSGLQEFHSRYPNIKLHFKAYSPSVLLDHLMGGDLDFICSPIFDPSVYQGCFLQKIADISLMAILPASHPLAVKHYLTKKDLAQQKLILACTPDSKIGEDSIIISSFREDGYQPDIIDKIEDVETILMMVGLQMGISILPSYITLPTSNDRRIVAIPYEPDVRVDYAAVCLDKNQNPALENIKLFLFRRFA